MSVTQDTILKALSTVIDPASGRDVVAAGLVTDLVIDKGSVFFSLTVDPARGPELEPLRKTAEWTVQSLPGVKAASVVLTAQRAASRAPAAGGGHRPIPTGAAPAPANAPLLPEVKHVIAVASGKGGVGKSTTSVNLALALAGMGLKVGLYDADIFGPSQPRLLGISGAKPVAAPDGRMQPIEVLGLKVMSIGFLVEEAAPLVWRGPMVMGAVEQLLRDVAWGALDVMIIDMPPGTGDTQLTITQKLPLSGAVIVSTPQDIALIDARKGLAMFQKVNVPLLGIIENMSVYHCPNCGHESHIFGHGGAQADAARFEVPFLGALPLDIVIRETSDAGLPVVLARPDGPVAAAYRQIAQTVWAAVAA